MLTKTPSLLSGNHGHRKPRSWIHGVSTGARTQRMHSTNAVTKAITLGCKGSDRHAPHQGLLGSLNGACFG